MNKYYMNVDEVSELLGIKKSTAYREINKLNAEMKEKGYNVVSGRVNRQYFYEKYYINPVMGGE